MYDLRAQITCIIYACAGVGQGVVQGWVWDYQRAYVSDENEVEH